MPKKMRILVTTIVVLAVALLIVGVVWAQDNPGRIGGTVYLDENANGQRDDSEPGVESVQVRFSTYDYENTLSTASDGRYSWTVTPATWTVTVIPPEGYEAVDGSREVFVDAGGEEGTVDFGLVEAGTTLPEAGAPISPRLALIGLLGLLAVGLVLVVVGLRRR